MAKKKVSAASTPSGDIITGDISGSTGVAVGHSAQATVTQSSGTVSDDIAQAFADIVQKVNALPDGPNKDDAKEAVQKLEVEARKGDQVDENRVQRWFSFLAETAPDAWRVAVDTFINPIKGVSTAFQKIAEKAKVEREKKEAEVKK